MNLRKEYHHRWYLKNKKQIRKKSLLYRLKNLVSYRAYQREYQKKLHRALKFEVLTHYSKNSKTPLCVCCGENTIQFLSIDHINNDGALHRKTLKSKGGNSFYKWLKKNNFPDGFQTLCHNCNLGRAVNSSVCPHQIEKLSNQHFDLQLTPDIAPWKDNVTHE